MKVNDDKLYSVEAEKAVLSAVFFDSNLIYEISEVLNKPEMFYVFSNRLIYETMLSLHKRNKPVDLITVADKLKSADRLEDVGGYSYLAGLFEARFSAVDARHHAEIVYQKHIRSALFNSSDKIKYLALSGDYSVGEILAQAEKIIHDISDRQSSQSFYPLKEVLSKCMVEIENAMSKTSCITGLQTGFIDLDQMTAGLQRGDLVIIAGRPSMGKTALATRIAENVAVLDQKPVAFVSLETGSTQLGMRLLCGNAKVNAIKLKTGQFDKSDYQKLADSLKISSSPLFICDASPLDIATLKIQARRLKHLHDIDLMVVDYLQLMTPLKRSQNREQEVSSISRALKAVAKELDITVIALSQLSRQCENRDNKRPRLSDLRDSGAIEQDADLVLFLYRPEYYGIKYWENNQPTENLAELIVAKHRNGPTGAVYLTFLKESVRFENASGSFVATH